MRRGAEPDATCAACDSSLPWVLVFGATIAWLLVDHPAMHDDAYAWAFANEAGLLGELLLKLLKTVL